MWGAQVCASQEEDDYYCPNFAIKLFPEVCSAPFILLDVLWGVSRVAYYETLQWIFSIRIRSYRNFLVDRGKRQDEKCLAVDSIHFLITNGLSPINYLRVSGEYLCKRKFSFRMGFWHEELWWEWINLHKYTYVCTNTNVGASIVYLESVCVMRCPKVENDTIGINLQRDCCAVRSTEAGARTNFLKNWIGKSSSALLSYGQAGICWLFYL